MGWIVVLHTQRGFTELPRGIYPAHHYFGFYPLSPHKPERAPFRRQRLVRGKGIKGIVVGGPKAEAATPAPARPSQARLVLRLRNLHETPTRRMADVGCFFRGSASILNWEAFRRPGT